MAREGPRIFDALVAHTTNTLCGGTFKPRPLCEPLRHGTIKITLESDIAQCDAIEGCRNIYVQEFTMRHIQGQTVVCRFRPF